MHFSRDVRKKQHCIHRGKSGEGEKFTHFHKQYETPPKLFYAYAKKAAK
jgi:hypothetical protein